ncbi:CCAAT/enhancer-binding protein zeta [Cricetulus griseus]|uniref:CCAAT/enhancer-binding protein zeta n=1 Tax=Cricetulus griseus TaxID=10029 RepID=A0A061HUV3_CRIGR|nr:CCAAT/enhancer-binding protein zeta [Cricetulus griseus]
MPMEMFGHLLDENVRSMFDNIDMNTMANRDNVTLSRFCNQCLQVTIAIKPFAIGLREDAGSRDMRLAVEKDIEHVLKYV